MQNSITRSNSIHHFSNQEDEKVFNMRALSLADTEKLLDLKTVIEKVEEAYVMKHTKEAVL